MRFDTLLITTAAALVLACGCTNRSGSASSASETQIAKNPPHDVLKAERVAQAEIAFEAAVRKADGDRNFAISQCAKIKDSRAMECMNKADAEFAAVSDRAKADLDTERL